jgi:hypothetical protein
MSTPAEEPQAIAEALRRRFQLEFLPASELPGIDWWDCRIVRSSGNKDAIVYGPKGVRLTKPEDYRNWNLNYALIRLQLAQHIKTARDYVRLVMFMRREWPTEPRAIHLMHQIQHVNHYKGKYELEDMFSDFEDAARTCSSTFDTMVTYHLRRSEDSQRFGVAWVKQFRSVPEEKLPWPPQEQRITCRQAREILRCWFNREKIGSVKRVPFPGHRTQNGFRAINHPLLTVHISDLPNSGNRTRVAGLTYWVREHHKSPPNPIRNGDFYRGNTNRVLIACLTGARDTWVTGIDWKTKKGACPEPVWTERCYMFCGSNFGICGHSQRATKTTLDEAKAQARREGLVFPKALETREGRLRLLEQVYPAVYGPGRKKVNGTKEGQQLQAKSIQ